MHISYKHLLAIALASSVLQAPAMSPIESLPAGFRDIRDPLLPPGYQKPEQEPDPQEEHRDAITAQINWPQLRLRGITQLGSDRFIAIIEGIGIVEPGEEVSIRSGDLIYTWRIAAIAADGMTTTRMHVTSVENPNAPIQIPAPPRP